MYIDEGRPLNEGEEKHVISVFVADEAGLINRVAGVFARRGANIESLAVGLNIDRALFTIVVAGTARTVSNLVKQLGKLVKVRYVEDITATKRVDRELMLIKVSAASGASRREVIQLSQIFRARVVDVSDASVTLCASGDPGKIAALQRVLARFGIVEIGRTGRISLKRGGALLEPSSASALPSEVVSRAPPGSDGPAAFISMDADVYMVDKDEGRGVWDVQNILEPPVEYVNDKGTAAGSGAGGDGVTAPDFSAHTLSLLVADIPGVLQQVTGAFARRGYNVQSLAVGPAEAPGVSRITMVVPGTERAIATLLKHVVKLVYVKQIADLTNRPYVTRELMLVKVRFSFGGFCVVVVSMCVCCCARMSRRRRPTPNTPLSTHTTHHKNNNTLKTHTHVKKGRVHAGAARRARGARPHLPRVGHRCRARHGDARGDGARGQDARDGRPVRALGCV